MLHISLSLSETKSQDLQRSWAETKTQHIWGGSKILNSRGNRHRFEGTHTLSAAHAFTLMVFRNVAKTNTVSAMEMELRSLWWLTHSVLRYKYIFKDIEEKKPKASVG